VSKQKKICYPDPNDDFWNKECKCLIPFLSGKGVDIGSGPRSIFKEDLRVDLDERINPDICCSGDALPFKNDEFDYLYSIHSFEHFENQVRLLREWARVVRKGGIIAIVHPDVSWTGVLRPFGLRPGENKYNEHKHEKSYSDFLSWLKENGGFGLKIIESGEAREAWSFYIILKKI